MLLVSVYFPRRRVYAMGAVPDTLRQVYRVLVILACLPIWAMLSLSKHNRPRQTWSFKRTMMVKAFQVFVRFGEYVFFDINSMGELSLTRSISNIAVSPNHKAINTGANVKAVWVPATPHLIRGDVQEWAESEGVSCEMVPGYWFEKEGVDIAIGAPPRPGEKVIYSLHGGAFTKHSAHPDNIISVLRHGLFKHTQSVERLFNLEYRLASRDTSGASVNPLPAQLLDAVAGYDYLVHTVGFSPEQIIFLGDSAGASLALGLVRYVLERSAAGDTDLPGVPAGLVLCSPWADMAQRTYDPGSSAIVNRSSDYLDLTSTDYVNMTTAALGRAGDRSARTNRYISLGSVDPEMEPVSFEGFPRTLIVCGGAETFRDQIHVLRKKMAEGMGIEHVELVEFADAIHDWCIFDFYEPERTQALCSMAEWIDAMKLPVEGSP